MGLKREGLPFQEAMATLLERPVNLVVKEENTAVISAIKNGYSPALRHLSRSMRVCLGSLNEMFFGGNPLDDVFGKLELHYVKTTNQKADGLTKFLPKLSLDAAIDCWGLCKKQPPTKEGVSSYRRQLSR